MDPKVLGWLLEESQPSVRYLALTELMERPKNDPEVREAMEMLARRGWAADILGRQSPGGWWVDGENLYRPRYLSTNWMLLTLSDLGSHQERPDNQESLRALD